MTQAVISGVAHTHLGELPDMTDIGINIAAATDGRGRCRADHAGHRRPARAAAVLGLAALPHADRRVARDLRQDAHRRDVDGRRLVRRDAAVRQVGDRGRARHERARGRRREAAHRARVGLRDDGLGRRAQPGLGVPVLRDDPGVLRAARPALPARVRPGRRRDRAGRGDDAQARDAEPGGDDAHAADAAGRAGLADDLDAAAPAGVLAGVRRRRGVGHLAQGHERRPVARGAAARPRLGPLPLPHGPPRPRGRQGPRPRAHGRRRRRQARLRAGPHDAGRPRPGDDLRLVHDHRHRAARGPRAGRAAARRARTSARATWTSAARCRSTPTAAC